MSSSHGGARILNPSRRCHARAPTQASPQVQGQVQGQPTTLPPSGACHALLHARPVAQVGMRQGLVEQV
jgi:hypothetical protein